MVTSSTGQPLGIRRAGTPVRDVPCPRCGCVIPIKPCRRRWRGRYSGPLWSRQLCWAAV